MPASLKRPARLVALLGMLSSSMLLSVPVSAQTSGVWPEDAALSDIGTSYEAGALPFYLRRPVLADELTSPEALAWGGQPLDASTSVLPVLRSGDGRIEALLFIDNERSALTLNPVERLLGDGTTSAISDRRIATGLRVQGSERLTLAADFGRNRSAGMALLCNEDIGLATTLNSLSEHCLLAQLGGDADPLSPFARRQTSEQHLGASLDFADRGLDLSFGLSWLQSDPLPTTAFGTTSSSLPGSTGLLYPSFGDGAAGQFSLRSEGIGVRGMLDLGSRRWLSLDGQVSRTRIDRGVIDSLMPSEWNSGRLGFGMGFGDFSGRITGHVVDVGGSDTLWGGLDIGLSWRTPWRAALTIGAKNVVSGGNKTWPQENAQALDEAQSRIPYVQYQQDL
ncbi:MAG: hypothetical protein R3F22_07360 [Lysobacteraceae bacterium]